MENLSKKTLSIVIPLYNEERTLAFLLEKVLNAPLNIDREIILVNDGSTDSSKSIAMKFIREHPAARIKYLERMGISTNDVIGVVLVSLFVKWA